MARKKGKVSHVSANPSLHGTSSSDYMSIRKYRLSKYDTPLNSFYNHYSWLNNVRDGGPQGLQIQQYQEQKIRQYQRGLTSDMDTKTALKRLNYDLFKYFEGYNENIDVVNDIISNLEEQIKSLYTDGTAAKKYTSVKSNSDYYGLMTVCDNLLNKYANILNMLTDYKNQPMISKYLKVFEEEYDNFLNVVSNLAIDRKYFKKIDKIDGYYGKLAGLSYFIKGFIGEETLVKEGLSKIPVPIGLANTGTLMVKYSHLDHPVNAPADHIAFSLSQLDLLKDIEIKYTKGIDKKEYTTTLDNFFTKVLKNNTTSIIISESTYLKICKKSLITIQSKFFKQNTSAIHMKSEQSFSDLERYFPDEHLKALRKMLELNEQSKNDNNGIESRYYIQHTKYQEFIDYSLGSNIGHIFGNNAFMLSGEKGVETVWDFANRKIKEGYMLKYGTSKTFNLLNIERNTKKPILFARP